MKKSMLLLSSIISFSLYAAAPLTPEQAVLELSKAVQDGDVDRARTLLQENDIDINATVRGGWSFLMDAAHHGHADIIELLLSQEGIDVNYAKTDKTALHWSAQSDSAASVEALAYDERVDINCQTEEGETPLMTAADSGKKENVRILLLAGADKTKQNKRGEDAVRIARRAAAECRRENNNKYAPMYEEIEDYIRDYIPSITKSAGKQGNHQ